ncbi:MAG: hypothetical protein K1X86_12685 [Ignavibacteria bacterium]|nr:hypothetical protein [Ignavibacteria bacterium]
MRKSFFYLILGIFCIGLMSNKSFAQYTAPETVLGLHLTGNLATNEGYGVGSAIYGGNTPGSTYGMKWGRGIGIDFSIGLGDTKRNRIYVGGEWNAMINANSSNIPFLLISPSETIMTYYNIYSLEAGYQYMWNARCKTKQWFTAGVSASMIQAPRYSVVNFEDATRAGAFAQYGYDFVLDQAGKWGLSLSAKYHLVNAFFHANGSGTQSHINDGNGLPGPGYDRLIGLLSVNVGINMYGGVKSLGNLMK